MNEKSGSIGGSLDNGGIFRYNHAWRAEGDGAGTFFPIPFGGRG